MLDVSFSSGYDTYFHTDEDRSGCPKDVDQRICSATVTLRVDLESSKCFQMIVNLTWPVTKSC